MNSTETVDRPSSIAVDTETLAAMLAVSIRHIQRMDASGRLPRAVKIGRSKRWSVKEINEWLEAGCPNRKTWSTIMGRDHAN